MTTQDSHGGVNVVNSCRPEVDIMISRTSTLKTDEFPIIFFCSAKKNRVNTQNGQHLRLESFKKYLTVEGRKRAAFVWLASSELPATSASIFSQNFTDNAGWN
jgi:hypothetical protein